MPPQPPAAAPPEREAQPQPPAAAPPEREAQPQPSAAAAPLTGGLWSAGGPQGPPPPKPAAAAAPPADAPPRETPRTADAPPIESPREEPRRADVPPREAPAEEPRRADPPSRDTPRAAAAPLTETPRDEPPSRDTPRAAAAPPTETPRDAPPRADPPPRDTPRAAAAPPTEIPAEDPRRAEPPPREELDRADDPPHDEWGRAAAPLHDEPPRDDPPAAADRADEPRAKPAPPREPLKERIGRVDPQAGELSELLRERLALPGIVAAGIAAGTSAAIVLAAGLLIALITPDASILGTVGQDASIITEGFRHAVGTLLTAMVDPGLLISGSRRIHPMLLLAIPLSALIFTTRWQLHRTEGAPPLARLGWAAVVALPFGLLMLAFAIIGGETETTDISPSPGSAFALGVMWGAIGGLIGAATKLPLAESRTRIPTTVQTVLTATVATLRPLAAVLVTCTAIGLVGWLVQVGADAGGVRNERSAATALIEEATFAGEHGVHLTALAAGARFRADANGPLGLPFPVADANDVPGRGGAFRIFSYDDALPAYVLLLALVLLMGLVTLGALYAGFAAARAVKAGSVATGAAWGAITGPAWAVAMALLVILAGGLFHGDADDASVFGVFLLGGALLGAAGGALSVSGQPAGGPASSSPSS